MDSQDLPIEIFEKFIDKNQDNKRLAEKDFKFYSFNILNIQPAIELLNNPQDKSKKKEKINIEEERITKLLSKLKIYMETSNSLLFKRGIFMSLVYLLSILQPLPLVNNDIIYHIIVFIKGFLFDNDNKIILISGEAIYSIIRLRNIYVIEFFSLLYECLLILVTNQDLEVKIICKNIDCLMKEKVNFYFEEEEEKLVSFSLNSFIEIILSQLTCPDLSVKLIVVSWITFIHSLPDIRLINYFHKFVPLLFNMLEIPEVSIGLTVNKEVKKLKTTIIKENKEEKEGKIMKDDKEKKEKKENEPNLNVIESIKEKEEEKETKVFYLTTSLAHSKADIKNKFLFADNLLKELYNELIDDFNSLTPEEETELLEMLIKHGSSENVSVMTTAFKWINLFLSKYKDNLTTSIESYMRGEEIEYKDSVFASQDYFTIVNKTRNVVLDKEKDKEKDKEYEKFQFNIIHNNVNMNYVTDDKKSKAFKSVKSVKSGGNSEMSFYIKNNKMNEHVSVPISQFPKILDIVIKNLNSKDKEISDLINASNQLLIDIIEIYPEFSKTYTLLFENVLKNYYSTEQVDILEKVIFWINKLFSKLKYETQIDFDSFLSELISILNHNNQKIFEMILDNICEIGDHHKELTGKILSLIINKFKINSNLMETKGTFIFKKLCESLPIEKILIGISDYIDSISISISNDTKNNKESLELNRKFSSKLISIMDYIIIDDSNSHIKDFLSLNSKDNLSFFNKLYKTWSINPVSTLQLALLSEFFDLSLRLVTELANLNLSVDDYLQLAFLVQLIESKAFLNLRVFLITPHEYQSLVKTLYGILLLLPHGKAYNSLNKRLKTINKLYKIDERMSKLNEKHSSTSVYLYGYSHLYSHTSKTKTESLHLNNQIVIEDYIDLFYSIRSKNGFSD